MIVHAFRALASPHPLSGREGALQSEVNLDIPVRTDCDS